MQKTYLLIFVIASNLLHSQGGVFNPGSYSNSTKIAACYKVFYKAPVKFDTLNASKNLNAQRVWRIIDFKEPATKILFTHNKLCEYIDLFEILKFGILSGKINAFSSDKFDANALKYKIEINHFLTLITLKDTLTETVFDSDGNSSISKKVTERQLNSDDLAGFLFCEDWFFDSHLSKLDKRMVYISPIFKNEKNQTEYPLFYFYYNECRELLSSFKASNKKTTEPISYDEFILTHQYPAFVTKTSNLFNRTITEYKKGTDIEGEHDNSLKKLHNSESDLFDH